jgi:hypothetical protein
MAGLHYYSVNVSVKITARYHPIRVSTTVDNVRLIEKIG